MSSNGDELVNIYSKNFSPGDLYDVSSKKIVQNGNAESIQTEIQCPSFSFEIWDKNYITSLQKRETFKYSAWMQDYVKENAAFGIMVKGCKTIEKRGALVPLDKFKHTIISVNYLCHADFLVLFALELSKKSIDDFRTYLLEVVHESSHSFPPGLTMQYFKCAYIYQSYNAPGKKLYCMVYAAKEFCRILRESDVSFVPITAYIRPPNTCDTLENNQKLALSNVNTSIGNVPQVHSQAREMQIPHCNDAVRFETGKGHGSRQKGSEVNVNPQPIGTGRGCGTMIGRGYSNVLTTSKEITHVGSANKVESTMSRTSFEERCERFDGATRNKEVLTGISYSNSKCVQSGSSNTMAFNGCSLLPEKRSETSCQSTKNMSPQKTEEFSKGSQRCNTENCQSEMKEKMDNGHTYNLRERKRYEDSEMSNSAEKDINKTVSEPNKNLNGQQSILEIRVNEDESRDSGQCIVKKADEGSKYVNYDKHKKDTSGESKLPQPNQSCAVSSQVEHSIMLKDSTMGRGKACYNKVNSQKEETIKQSGSNSSNTKRISQKEEEIGQSGSNSSNTKRISQKEEEMKQLGSNFSNTKVICQKEEEKECSKTSRSENKNNLLKGLGCEASDEPSDLKIGSYSTATLENMKHKHDKGKAIEMKAKLLNPVKTCDDPCGFRRKYYGVVNDTVPEKVMMFLGASGSGKTMLVNFIANFFMEKKSADDDLIHVEGASPTSAITAYTFCRGNDEVPITIIDTPGLNDSSGAEVKDHVEALKKFLAHSTSKGLEIHAIGFVAQAYLVRLTSSERMVMNYVSTMFGQSISQHLITLVTFADNQDSPPVVEAMKNYGVNFKLFLKFNNSTLSSSKSDETEDLDRVYWRICWRNWKKCMKTLKEMSALSVNTMKAVQSEVYSRTVIKSAEEDLQAELKTFFTYCKNDSWMSKDALEVCESVWELAAIVHRLRYTQNSALSSVNIIIIEVAMETCKTLCISPDKYVNYIFLCPSRSLVVSGAEIIRSMLPFYDIATKWHANSEVISKSICEWAYCHRCEKEHKLKRYEPSGVKKYFPVIGPSTDVLALKCVDCTCPGEVHGVSSVKSPLHYSKLLEHTKNCLSKALTDYTVARFPVQEKTFLNFLNHHFHFEHQVFIGDLLKLRKY